MASNRLVTIIKNESTSFADELDAETLDRILTEPHQNALAEAMAADVVDIVPVLGDLAAMARAQRAEEDNLAYPDQPAYVENAISDLPFPIDTIGDIVVSQHVLLYLKREYGIDLTDNISSINEAAAENYVEIIDAVTPN